MLLSGSYHFDLLLGPGSKEPFTSPCGLPTVRSCQQGPLPLTHQEVARAPVPEQHLGAWRMSPVLHSGPSPGGAGGV